MVHRLLAEAGDSLALAHVEHMLPQLKYINGTTLAEHLVARDQPKNFSLSIQNKMSICNIKINNFLLNA